MVPNLPYFMVQFDYKGEKGYGHVIEGTNAAEETEEGMDEGEKGGGDFPRSVMVCKTQVGPDRIRPGISPARLLETCSNWSRVGGGDQERLI